MARSAKNKRTCISIKNTSKKLTDIQPRSTKSCIKLSPELLLDTPISVEVLGNARSRETLVLLLTLECAQPRLNIPKVFLRLVWKRNVRHVRGLTYLIPSRHFFKESNLVQHFFSGSRLHQYFQQSCAFTCYSLSLSNFPVLLISSVLIETSRRRDFEYQRRRVKVPLLFRFSLVSLVGALPSRLLQ